MITEKLSEYNLFLLSGDNDSEKPRLEKVFAYDKMLFNQSPENKLDYINSLIKANRQVMMLGDGLNDAGALQKSHVGISIADDIYNYSPACDAILKAEKVIS